MLNSARKQSRRAFAICKMEFTRVKAAREKTPKMPAKRQVLGLRVSSDSNQGGRAYMEDMVSIRYERREGDDCAFFGVFDGHGGKEAAVFARDTLWETIKLQRGFESKDPEKVKQAISDGFLKTQEAMWKKRKNWGMTKSGYPSTSGTTACVAMIRARHMWIANAGDSRAVLGVLSQRGLRSRTATVDHKPESPREIKRIEAIGGKIQNKNGVQRVVWERTKLDHNGPVRRSTNVDQIPFLAVARSLGDLWSYSTLHDDYVISPKPDINHHVLDPKVHQCLVIGSDGLWNMLSSSDAIYILSMYNLERRKAEKMKETMSQRLVKNSINRWVLRSLRADNTTAITIVFDFPKEAVKSPKTSSSESGKKEVKKDEESTPESGKEEESTPNTSKGSIESTTTPEAKASTSSESTEENEEIGTELRVRGETDFLGVQGFGSFRPKLRHSKAFRDWVFRFHYPEPEQETWKSIWVKTHSEKRKREDTDDSDEEEPMQEWQQQRWKPDGETYINTPFYEVDNGKRKRKRTSSPTPSPWVTPRDEEEEKCDCFECHNNWAAYCLRRKKKSPSTRVEIVREYLTNPEYQKEMEKEKKCRCFECKKGIPEWCTGGPKVPKIKSTYKYKQTRYNTRSSPTEPEVPITQRALRSLNKKSTPEAAKSKSLTTPVRKRLNGRRRATIHSC